MENINSDLPPTVLVIFGITGDLSHRYLLSALSEICRNGRLPKHFKIIGVSRHAISKEELFHENERPLAVYGEPLQMDYSDSASYQALKDKIAQASSAFGAEAEVIFYLAVPPDGVLPIIQHLGQAGLNTTSAKLLLEKPFGVNLESAKQLISEIGKYFPPPQVYRIDHYLAKEMAQNIVVFLGSNSMIRDIWDNRFIQKIEIEAAEQIGIEHRVNFYESTGALRDMVQSHLMQLAALTLMEPCSSIFYFNEMPVRRLAALQSLSIASSSAVRGQYRGYRDEINNQNSSTETFVSLTLMSRDPRWLGVPICLVTGKSLDAKYTAVKVYFKKTHESEQNLLMLRIQPEEGIELHLFVKQPGYERRLQKVPLDFKYQQHFDHLPDAYEQVLIDVITSNQSLFPSGNEVLASWKIIEPVLKKWAKDNSDLVIYEPGSKIEDVLRLAKS